MIKFKKEKCGLRIKAAVVSLSVGLAFCAGCSGCLTVAAAAGHTGKETAVAAEISEPEDPVKPKDGAEEAARPKEKVGNADLQPPRESEEPGDAKTPLQKILALKPGETVTGGLTDQLKEEDLEACFYYEEIQDELFERMRGKSYREDCTVPRSDLRYVRFLHHGFDGEIHIGELVVNQAIASDIRDIFYELFEAEYLIEKAVLIDEYEADDEASMRDNNTSCFNFRAVAGSKTLSNHALGLAIDINPLYNPYVKAKNGAVIVQPSTASEYTDRKADCAYYISKGDACYEAFISRGFSWGGNWKSLKDYQHFERR